MCVCYLFERSISCVYICVEVAKHGRVTVRVFVQSNALAEYSRELYAQNNLYIDKMDRGTLEVSSH